MKKKKEKEEKKKKDEKDGDKDKDKDATDDNKTSKKKEGTVRIYEHMPITRSNAFIGKRSGLRTRRRRRRSPESV